MNYNLSFLFIIFTILTCLLFCSSDAYFATTSSLIPFQFSRSSKPMFHIGVLKDSSEVQPVAGIQIQPTSNLLVGGVISPRESNDDLSIYYQMLIGYIPQWKLLKFSSNMIQLGMHRYRFSDIGDSRWLSFSVMESARIGSLNLNLCWNKLFTQTWERNTILISTKINLVKDIYIQPGAVAFFTPNFDYSPFLLVSIQL